MTEWGIDTLFNPGKRHMDEEKRRLQSTREEIGDASGGRRIDLESGTVRISRSGKAVRPDEPSGNGGADSTAEEHAADERATSTSIADSKATGSKATGSKAAEGQAADEQATDEVEPVSPQHAD